MSTIGIDYSFTEPDFKKVKQVGYSFALSYFSNDQSKDWSKAEMQRALDAGLAVGAVFETSGKRPLDGYNAGVADAKNAIGQANEIDYKGALYFAVDFRPSASQLLIIFEYFKGIASVLPKEKIGAYGSYEVMDKVQGFVKYGWQVSTWAPKVNGKYLVHPIACILQDANTKPLVPNTDHNLGLKDDMGLMGGKMSADKLTKEEFDYLHILAYGGLPGAGYDGRYTGRPLTEALHAVWGPDPLAEKSNTLASKVKSKQLIKPSECPSTPAQSECKCDIDAIAEAVVQKTKEQYNK